MVKEEPQTRFNFRTQLTIKRILTEYLQYQIQKNKNDMPNQQLKIL